MAKKTRKKTKKKKNVAKSPTHKAPAKRKGKTKTAAKKATKKVAKKAMVKAKPAKKAGPASRVKVAKRKVAARRPPLDLRRFRKQLRQKQSELLQAYISTKVNSRSREVDGTEDYIDYAVSSYDREFLLSLTELEQNQLTLVDAAIKRLGSGKFGACTQCERPIPTKRLEVQPWAQYCLRCQELADQGIAADDDDSGDDDVDGSDAEDDEARDDDRQAEIE